jgi:hypothetical protein
MRPTRVINKPRAGTDRIRNVRARADRGVEQTANERSVRDGVTITKATGRVKAVVVRIRIRINPAVRLRRRGAHRAGELRIRRGGNLRVLDVRVVKAETTKHLLNIELLRQVHRLGSRVTGNFHAENVVNFAKVFHLETGLKATD